MEIDFVKQEAIPLASKVTIWRNLPNKITSEELEDVANQFGAVHKIVLLRKKNRALVEFDTTYTSVLFLESCKAKPLMVQGREIHVGFSEHQDLSSNFGAAPKSSAPASAITGAMGTPWPSSGLVVPTMLSLSDDVPSSGLADCDSIGSRSIGQPTDGATTKPLNHKQSNQPSTPVVPGQNRILLVTLQRPLIQFTWETLSVLFAPYGSVEKVVILNKKVMQALIQYDSVMSAIKAFTALDGETVYGGCCTLSIQYSKLKELSVPVNTDMAHDFTIAGSILQAYYGPSARVIHVSNLSPMATADALFNVFSNYGNVSRIKPLGCEAAIIEMEASQSAADVVHYLNTVPLFGKDMSVSLSETQLANDNLGCIIDFTVSPHNRFPPGRNGHTYRCNAPNSVLHVSNLAEGCTDRDLYSIMAPFGVLLAMKLYTFRGVKQALVEFNCLPAAVNALAQTHGSVLGGQPIRVSFSRNGSLRRPTKKPGT